MSEDVAADLARVGERIRAAEAARDEAMYELQALVVQAHGTVPIARIAELAGVSRPTVYKLLRA